MGRGPVVAKRRDAVNAVKWKVFAIHAKLIALAAQSGGDVDMNPTLAMEVEKAKKAWVPNDNIDRAIRKWTWEDKDAAQIVEIVYEWHAAGWAAIIVQVLTDNKNRAAASIRHIFTKASGNMWTSGSVDWMFKRKGVIIIDSEVHDYDSIEELVMETDAEDISQKGREITILTALEDFTTVEKYFQEKNIELHSSELEFVPDNVVEITDFDKALKYKMLINGFEEDEDVQNVFGNWSMTEELEEEIEAFIEKNTFRT